MLEKPVQNFVRYSSCGLAKILYNSKKLYCQDFATQSIYLYSVLSPILV